MSNERPIVSLGHVVIKTDRIADCVDFYTALGMTKGNTNKPQQRIALMQMRGGTDLILIASDHPFATGDVDDPDHPFAAGLEESRVSYGDYVGPLDLLIASREREDLAVYREDLIKAGLEPSEIKHEELTNHHTFSVVDPDGRKVTILTNHANYEIKN